MGKLPSLTLGVADVYDSWFCFQFDRLFLESIKMRQTGAELPSLTALTQDLKRKKAEKMKMKLKSSIVNNTSD